VFDLDQARKDFPPNLQRLVAFEGGRRKRPLSAGDVLINAKGEPHGMLNESGRPLYFVTVISHKKSDFIPTED
jgi:quercetin dioxygenase-like cupin family protein